MKKNKGNALVVILVIIVVLLVIITSVLDSRTKRGAMRKYMSDEKKAEAFAEAVLDRVIADIREKANDDQETIIYNLLRKKYANPGCGEKNKVVSISAEDLIPPDYYSSIQSAFVDDGGSYKILDDVKAEIVHVENFGGEYEVVGVDVMPSSPESYVKSSGESNPSNDNWELSFMYPTTTNSEVDAINKAYADKYDTGIFNAYSSTQVSGIDSKFMGYKYVSQPIDIDLELATSIKDIIDDFDADVGDFEKTKVDLLLKDTGDVTKKTAMEFGVYVSDKLFKSLKNLMEDILDKYRGNLVSSALTSAFGSAEDKASLDKIEDMLNTTFSSEEEFNNQINEKLHSFLSDNQTASKYIENGNTVDLEKLMTEKVSAFKNLDLLKPSKMLDAIGGGGTIDNNWLDKANPQGSLESDLIEKGGILRLTCKVEYTPNGKDPIKKKLVTEIPFKVSDVQPIAPTYTFFVNNSSSDVSCGDSAKVELVGNSESAGSPDEIFVLNNGNRLDGKDFDSSSKKIIPYKAWSSEAPCAGKVRINGNDLGEDNIIPTNCGGLEDGELGLTDMPMLCITKNEVKSYPYKSNLQLKLTFGFAEGQGNCGEFLKPTKIHFPTLAGVEKAVQGPLTGFESIVKMFEGCATSNILDKPTYLYGYGHLDYPLGITVEGKVESSLSEICAHLFPKLTFSVDLNDNGFKFEPKNGKIDSEFQIWYEIQDKNDFPTNESTKISYGLPNINKDKTSLKAYDPDSPENWPDFLYSDIQYKKKASRYYKDQSGFDSDCNIDVKEGGLSDGGNIRLDGVIYIEGNVSLGNKTFVGSGLIVAEECMEINGNIELADNNGKNSSLGLIARKGSMSIKACEVNASCYSNAAPTLTAATIKGNLVTNSFDRSKVTGVTNIVYCSKNIVVADTDFSDLYKQNPKRYYASFANNWSKSYYDKNVND